MLATIKKHSTQYHPSLEEAVKLEYVQKNIIQGFSLYEINYDTLIKKMEELLDQLNKI